MAKPSLSNLGANTALDAMLNLANNGFVRIYSGTMPVDADTALSGNTLLADAALSADPFPAATGGVATATSPGTDPSADATGVATFFRLTNSAGAVILQGDVSATGGGGDMTLASTSLTSGGGYAITSFTVRQAKS